MRLQDERYEEIKEIVVTLFENLDISCTPISGFEIAKKLGIIVIPYSATKHCEELTLKYEDAICLEKDDALYIYYNDKKSYERLNWTFLHEIGHLVLGHTEHCELAESEADFFAKFAIAPPVLIHRYKLSTVEDIEDRFCISHIAAINALNYYRKWLLEENIISPKANRSTKKALKKKLKAKLDETKSVKLSNEESLKEFVEKMKNTIDNKQ